MYNIEITFLNIREQETRLRARARAPNPHYNHIVLVTCRRNLLLPEFLNPRKE